MTQCGRRRVDFRRVFRAGVVVGATIAAGVTGLNAAAQDADVIVLTQTPCQFIESEKGVDHGFKTTKKADCDVINRRTGAARLAKAGILKLKPGKYVFRVTNKNVPYPLGFWFRSKGYDWRNPLHRITKISVSGGGLETGKTQDYAVTLEAGEYVYSCPLNPTPDYRVIVKE